MKTSISIDFAHPDIQQLLNKEPDFQVDFDDDQMSFHEMAFQVEAMNTKGFVHCNEGHAHVWQDPGKEALKAVRFNFQQGKLELFSLNNFFAFQSDADHKQVRIYTDAPHSERYVRLTYDKGGKFVELLLQGPINESLS